MTPPVGLKGRVLADVEAGPLGEARDALAKNGGDVLAVQVDVSRADQVDALLANLSRTTQRLDATLANLQDVTDHVRTGPSIAHANINGGTASSNAISAVVALSAPGCGSKNAR